MNCSKLEFKTKTASVQSVIEHLRQCSNIFNPPLHTYVDIKEYSKKIIDNATTFEAWENNLLIGLLAAYVNDFKSKTCFITNLSILPQHQRRGIAQKLVVSLLEHCTLLGFVRIKFETNKGNSAVLNLFFRNGFGVTQQKDDTLIMERVLKSQ